WNNDFRKLLCGLPGVETSWALMYNFGVRTGRIELTDLVRLMAVNPAAVYGISNRKGSLAPGMDADFVVFDPEHEWTVRAAGLHMGCDYSPYEGLTLKGSVRTVVKSGSVMVRDGAFVSGTPGGRFLQRNSPGYK
ncbi:MAG: amidohydrolase family protein, partial [Candidatus Wallbacteria bacterium]|nr:amidohydrolase family protein [Candidatus Wallbacteria bacterium]